MQRDNFRTRGFSVWRLCIGNRAYAPHIEERNKWGNIPLDVFMGWTSILFSYCYESPERDKRIDHVQLNDHFLIQIVSNRVTPITTFVAVKRHSYLRVFCVSAPFSRIRSRDRANAKFRDVN